MPYTQALPGSSKRFTAAYTVSSPAIRRSHLMFDVDMNAITEYQKQYKKYSAHNPVVQKRIHQLEKLQENLEFSSIFEDKEITQEQKDVLSNLLIRCQKKEMLAIRQVEQKIFLFFRDHLINEREARYILNILKGFKIPNVPSPQEPPVSLFPIKETVLVSEKVDVKEKLKSSRKSTTQVDNGATRYGDFINAAEHMDRERKLREGKDSYSIEFRTVLSDCKTWIMNHLDVQKDDSSAEVVNSANAPANLITDKCEMEKLLDEEIQKIVNVWESSAQEIFSERFAIPEYYPPFAIKKSIMEVVGIKLAELEKGPWTKPVYGSVNPRKSTYGMWFIPPSKWDALHQKMKKKESQSDEKIIELETRSYIRKRVLEIVGPIIQKVE